MASLEPQSPLPAATATTTTATTTTRQENGLAATPIKTTTTTTTKGADKFTDAAVPPDGLFRNTSRQLPGTVATTAQTVESSGNFPSIGSILGNYYCLGRLGKGTFCSIHKCIDLSHYEHKSANNNNNKNGDRPRLVAAKVELDDFTNSGVLEGEATMLHHLYESLPPQTVPQYMGHFRAPPPAAAAIVMEFLPGMDMHQIREQNGNRRMTTQDAVHLCADVLLVLLRRMHEAGVVHRDVKPSNSVLQKHKTFCMVDFGLSKSLLVSKDSTAAGPHVWNDTKCLRQERAKADFRGTSMYASLRVHQLRDYTFRDDIWSLLYVFCDLISGGLPWMSYAATRDRDACQRIKEKVHGESSSSDGTTAGDQTEQMLMGEYYHVAKYKRTMAEKAMQENGGAKELPPLPEPLKLSRDAKKVDLLRQAFAHVSKLTFADKPDYDFIQQCLHGFLENPVAEDEVVTSIRWETDDDKNGNKDEKKYGRFSPVSSSDSSSKKRKRGLDQDVPSWEVDFGRDDSADSDELWQEVEEQAALEDDKSLEGEAADMARLPVEYQFRIAQLDYHAKHAQNTPFHVILRDWMKVAIPLVYGTWDSALYERGNHRMNQDGYRRDHYLKLVNKCLEYASSLGNFADRSYYYDTETNKRRVILSSSLGELSAVSRVLVGLKAARAEEVVKRSAPPPALSFSQGT